MDKTVTKEIFSTNSNHNSSKKSIYPEMQELLSAVVYQAFKDLVDGYYYIFQYFDEEPDLLEIYSTFRTLNSSHAMETYRWWEDAKRFIEGPDLIIFTRIPKEVFIEQAKIKAKELIEENKDKDKKFRSGKSARHQAVYGTHKGEK